ncbi:peptide ligase PGM1-related protein [Nitratireductor sp. XY-223]|uniref:peptide ligase PGM1-related protein n=1 Tax=Nitratireductor sp. XY-223 TaxID=2561926 RepID=UPI001FEE6BC3|nr:peptide ligase PGM1-related protein [Nitratireductor sp. XY-223]
MNGIIETPEIEDEVETFNRLQSGLPDLFERVFPDRLHPRTVLIIPSLSLDQEVLSKISGVHHYEERMLCMLQLLRMPRTRIIYVSSQPIAECIIDYYLHLLPGVPQHHARERLKLVSCHDDADVPLTQKILDRPRLCDRIGNALGDRSLAHMACFNVTPLERRLAARLGIPIYGCDPALQDYGSKSGSRKLFRESGLPIAEGFEDLADDNDIAEALTELKRQNPDLRRAVIKLNEGFSGEGNAIFRFDKAPDTGIGKSWVSDRLPGATFCASDMTWELFENKIDEMGCIVEAYVEGTHKRSPSVQYRVDPSGHLDPVSTHDQILGGSGDQVFLGCRFPADRAYRLDIQDSGMRTARLLKERGVLGHFGIDFVSVREGDAWRHYAIEINLRKGGTTHPLTMLRLLTDGAYDSATGLFSTPGGETRYYYATDNLESEHYHGLTPQDLIDIAVRHNIHFHGSAQRGVVFHLIGALSQYGKLGMVCVDKSHEDASHLYHETIAILDREGSQRP